MFTLEKKKQMLKNQILKNQMLKKQILKKQILKFNENITNFNNTKINIDVIENYKLKLNNFKLKKIVNIYQKKYINNNCQGIGDFIRGSFFLLQFCMLNNLEFDVDYSNHPVSNFLHKENEYIKYEINCDNIIYYEPNNQCETNVKFYKEFISYLNSINSETLYFFSNNYPYMKIGDFQRNFIRKNFLPNNILKESIEESLKNLNLDKNNFVVLHIRSGDRFIVSNEDLDDEITNTVNNLINETININDKYLLLSDNNKLKNYISNNYSNFIINSYDIAHTGYNQDNNDNIKNTLIDFFIMSYSSKIISYSPYGHGSGFSEYCSIIFNIPYEFHSLNIKF